MAERDLYIPGVEKQLMEQDEDPRTTEAELQAVGTAGLTSGQGWGRPVAFRMVGAAEGKGCSVAGGGGAERMQESWLLRPDASRGAGKGVRHRQPQDLCPGHGVRPLLHSACHSAPGPAWENSKSWFLATLPHPLTSGSGFSSILGVGGSGMQNLA